MKNDLFIESADQNIEILYDRLKLSTYNILHMVEAETDFKGIFNPKKDKLFGSEYNDEFLNFQFLLKNLNNIVYYNSLILISYSIFEYSFKLICRYAQDHRCPPIKFKDPHSDILNKCKNYLDKETNLIDFKQDGLEDLYLKIKNVNKLRSLITHHNGNLFKDRSKTLIEQKDYDLYYSDDRLLILGSGQVFIDDSLYIQCFISDSETFLKILINKLKSKI